MAFGTPFELASARRQTRVAGRLRYAEMNDEDLLDERVGLTRMSFVERVESGRQVPTDRYSFEPQRSNVRTGKELYYGEEKFGEVVTIDQTRAWWTSRNQKDRGSASADGLYVERAVTDGSAGWVTLPDRCVGSGKWG